MMRAFMAILKRELRAYFVSPLAWVIAAFFLLVQGGAFSIIIGHLSDPRVMASTNPFGFFFSGFFFWITLLFITPVITMRLMSEERRSGTLESLMTAPVGEGQVVMAKFFAALGFYAFLWLPTLVYPILIHRQSPLDWGQVASGYLGILSLGAMWLSIGLFGSSLSKSQIVAAVITFGLLMVFFVLPWTQALLGDSSLAKVFDYMDLIGHMEELGQGIIDSRRLIYHLSTTALFLFLTARTLEARKWK